MSLRRSLHSSCRVLDSNSASSTTAAAAPQLLRRTKDALMSSPSAQHYVLPSGSHFIIRSPPSSLPPSYPIPPTASTSALPAESLEPAPSTSQQPRLTAQQIEELQSLRASNPSYWTRSKLASKFGITANTVGILGWGQGIEARRLEKERREAVQQERERKESKWGWKKSIAREERRRRRSLW